MLRRDADSAGCFEENVGRGFLPDNFFTCDNCIKEMPYAKPIEDQFNDVSIPPGSDSHWQSSMIVPSDLGHHMNWFYLRDELEVLFFFFVSHRQRINA